MSHPRTCAAHGKPLEYTDPAMPRGALTMCVECVRICSRRELAKISAAWEQSPAAREVSRALERGFARKYGRKKTT